MRKETAAVVRSTANPVMEGNMYAALDLRICGSNIMQI